MNNEESFRRQKNEKEGVLQVRSSYYSRECSQKVDLPAREHLLE